MVGKISSLFDGIEDGEFARFSVGVVDGKCLCSILGVMVGEEDE